MLEIVEALKGEYIELARGLFEEYAASLSFDLGFQDFERELANLPGDYGRPEGRLLIALSAGDAVGCVAIRKLSEGVCEMKRLYVTARWRRAGIGRALCESVIAEARRIGYASMRLDTAPSMRAARALYVALGFKEIGRYRYNPLEGAVFMEMALNEANQ